jgi:hypothetical protein
MTTDLKYNKYLNRVKDVVAWAKGSPLNSGYTEHDYALGRLDEYLEGFFQTSPFSPGDRVVFKEDRLDLVREGWSGFPLLFRKGSPATVGEIDFRKGLGWVALFSFDHVYYNSSHEGAGAGKTSGYTRISVPRPAGEETWFHLTQDKFVLLEEFDGIVVKAPWDGCECVGSHPTNKIHCKVEGCKVWCWHHHGECNVHPNSFAQCEIV